MTHPQHNTHTRSASLFRGILNDFKRRPEDAAKELGLSNEYIDDILTGAKPLEAELVEKICQLWPVNPRDFAIIQDDAPNGVIVMRATESAASRRVMTRNGKDYYEYRDTACSRVSSFRPEWIKELHIVEDNDAENNTVEWNNGHFMHQFTYFIGPVNFYYLDEQGQKQVAVMNTGDSMYISPFVPHTFATRANTADEQGLILALTYGNNLLGDAQQELNAVSQSLSMHYCLDTASPQKITGALIRYHMNNLSLTLSALSEQTGINQTDLEKLISGHPKKTDYDVLVCIATAMNISLRELLGHDRELTKVVVQTDGPSWPQEGKNYRYSYRQLASSPLVPMSKALSINIDAGDREFCGDQQIGLHQYLYNIGNSPVLIRWQYEGQAHTQTLAVGDSAYLKPFLLHDYVADNGQLLSLRIQSKMSGDCLLELSHIGRDYVGRIVAENQPWFNRKGRS
ncbi:MAG: helix-turn-helix domain-containing protein [Agarilytica sp.]